jgi:hypothetical protein
MWVIETVSFFMATDWALILGRRNYPIRPHLHNRCRVHTASYPVRNVSKVAPVQCWMEINGALFLHPVLSSLPNVLCKILILFTKLLQSGVDNIIIIIIIIIINSMEQSPYWGTDITLN